jgi:hypothetical protein
MKTFDKLDKEKKERISKESKKWIDSKLKLKNYIFFQLVTPIGLYFLSIIMNKDYAHTIFIFIILILFIISSFITYFLEQWFEDRQIDIDLKKLKANPDYKADLREQVEKALLKIAEDAKEEKLNGISVATPTSRPYQGSLKDLKSAQQPIKEFSDIDNKPDL